MNNLQTIRAEKEVFRQKFLSTSAILPSEIHITALLMKCGIVPCNYYAFLKGGYSYMSLEKCREFDEILTNALNNH